MSESPVQDPADEASLRELVKGLLEKCKELEARLVLVEMRPTVFPAPHYPDPFQPPFVVTCQNAGAHLPRYGWTV